MGQQPEKLPPLYQDNWQMSNNNGISIYAQGSTANNTVNQLQINQSVFYTPANSVQYEKELRETVIVERQMARLAHEDLETFKEKQTQLIKKFDPRELKQQRALPPINYDSTQGSQGLQRTKTRSVPMTARGQVFGTGLLKLNLVPQFGPEDKNNGRTIGDDFQSKNQSSKQNQQEQRNLPPIIKKKKTNIQQDFFDLESKLSSIQNAASIESYKRKDANQGAHGSMILVMNQTIPLEQVTVNQIPKDEPVKQEWGKNPPKVNQNLSKIGTLKFENLLNEIN
ncbi:UNKNOWN [Stylonychia lemnae]|uniref:Uncharacterized protein n=1 Tax=Stylonychia lemnae TaxID=5949 RepID=A0A078B6G5_STYLE|nr:UNKNOWN [Stylonychia lemnae]|eukprot:CDW90120.1 UNKNOWN [Stylonychia lemnae]